MQILRIYNKNIGMEFGLEINMCHADNEKQKRQMTEGMKQPNQ